MCELLKQLFKKMRDIEQKKGLSALTFRGSDSDKQELLATYSFLNFATW